MISGDEVLEILRKKYERRPVLRFATLENTRKGDILFATGNGVNTQPAILRVLEAPLVGWGWGLSGETQIHCKIMVSIIDPTECSVCVQECTHPHVMPFGALLQTETDRNGVDQCGCIENLRQVTGEPCLCETCRHEIVEGDSKLCCECHD